MSSASVITQIEQIDKIYNKVVGNKPPRSGFEFKQFDTISRLLIKNKQPEYLLCELFLSDGKYENITINCIDGNRDEGNSS